MTTDIEPAAAKTSEAPPGNKNMSSSSSYNGPIDTEKLGRSRPAIFANGWVETGFCISVLGSMMMAEFLISGFSVLLPVLIEDTGIDPSQRTWPITVFSLVTGSLLLPFGLLVDMFGGYPVYLGGISWLAIWAVAGGFSRTFPMVLATRALQGVGAAAFLPAGTTLLGTTYRPGPRKNTIFSLYGGCAPPGFFSGIIFFWIASILLAFLCVMTYFCVPHEWRRGDWSSMDCLLTYAITDASHVEGHWTSPQIIVTFILGLISLAAFIYVEGWVAQSPLLPFDLFSIKYIGPLFIALFMACGCFGIYLFYASFYIRTVLQVPPLLAALWFSPMAAGGIIIALVGGVTLHRLPRTILLLLAGTGFVICPLLFALIPENPNYWRWVFPAMVCTTIGIGISFNVSGIFITTSVPKHQQGLAGACINGLSFLGISFFLGWAGFALISRSSNGLGESYKVAFWFAVGCGAGVILLSDFTVDEKAQQRQALHESEKVRPEAAVTT
ncbi:membrane transporter [Daldinia bambusicola]|nr:membrane transporter [Daldinia bambusicola]